jgi:polar amino acid transport system substrate-binding protein
LDLGKKIIIVIRIEEEAMMKKLFSIFVLFTGLTFLSSVPLWGGPVVDRILKNQTLVVGTSANQPPLTAKNKKGDIIGFDVDLAKAMAEAMGVKLRIKVIPFPELLPALESQKIDMVLSGMTIVPKRNLKIAFVGPYLVSGKGILTKLTTLAAAQDPNDLNKSDLTLAALKDSTSEAFAKGVAPKAKLVTTETLDQALRLLFDDKVDVLVADYPFCAVAAFKYENEDLVAGEARFTFEPLGVGIAGDDPLLVNWVENFMIRIKGTGHLEMLTNRWFKDASWVNQLP